MGDDWRGPACSPGWRRGHGISRPCALVQRRTIPARGGTPAARKRNHETKGPKPGHSSRGERHMTPDRLYRTAIVPALAELSQLGIPSTPFSARFVLAIALQESNLA